MSLIRLNNFVISSRSDFVIFPSQSFDRFCFSPSVGISCSNSYARFCLSFSFRMTVCISFSHDSCTGFFVSLNSSLKFEINSVLQSVSLKSFYDWFRILQVTGSKFFLKLCLVGSETSETRICVRSYLSYSLSDSEISEMRACVMSYLSYSSKESALSHTFFTFNFKFSLIKEVFLVKSSGYEI